MPAPYASVNPMGLVQSMWQNPSEKSVPLYDCALLGPFGPVWFFMSVRAVACNRASSAAGCLRSSGWAASTSAPTPAASGVDIDVPCSQPNPAPWTLKQAKSISDPDAAHSSPEGSTAPRIPQPPYRKSLGPPSNLGIPSRRAPPGAATSPREP